MSSPEARRNRRRRKVAGFIEPPPFTTVEQAKEYVSGDKIQCLLCGKWFKALGWHINAIHGVDETAYKLRFSIPYGVPLASASSSERYSLSISAKVDKEELRERLKYARSTRISGGKNRPIAQTVMATRLARIRSVNESASKTVHCVECGADVIVAQFVTVSDPYRCRECRRKMTAEERDKIKQWIHDNEQRMREYGNAKQHLRRGNPEPAIAYEKRYGTRLRSLDNYRR